MPTLFSDLLPEIFEEIAWDLVIDEPNLLTAISSLLPLLLTSKHVYAALSPGHALSYSNGQRYPMHAKLYARLCAAYVDVGAVKRRWWGRLQAGGESGPPSSALTAHLINVVRTLRFYKRSMKILQSPEEEDATLARRRLAPIYAPTVPLHLTTTMLLCLEHDSKNMPLLLDVGAHMFIHMLMLGRLAEGRGENDAGWLVENILNTLSLWCFWYVSSGKETLENETLSRREWIINLVLPFVVTPFRYASALSPPTHFTLPISNLGAQLPAVTWTAHGAYPLYYTREHPYSEYQLAPVASLPSHQPRAEGQVHREAAAPQVQALLAGTAQDAVADPANAELEVLRGDIHDERLVNQGRTPSTAIENGTAQGADSGSAAGGSHEGGRAPERPVAGQHGSSPGPSRPNVPDESPPPPNRPSEGPRPPATSAEDALTPVDPGPPNTRASPPRAPIAHAQARRAFNAPAPIPQAQVVPPPPIPQAQATPSPPAITLHTPYMPMATRPRPTPVNSHLHPSTGIHIFWYSSPGLWRAERERVSRAVEEGRSHHRRGDSHTAERAMADDDDDGVKPTVQEKVLAVGQSKGKKRERKRKEMSHREARKRSRLDSSSTSVVAEGEWRPYGETPEQSGDEGSSSDSSDGEKDMQVAQGRGGGEGFEEDIEWDSEEARKVWEEHNQSVEQEWAKLRMLKEKENEEITARRAAAAQREKDESQQRFYSSFLVHPSAQEFEYDISARFPECASFDPLRRITTAASPHTGPFASTTPSPTATPRTEKRESTPTPYNAYAPLRMLLPPASIPAKLIFLSRREAVSLEAPDPSRGARRAPPPAEEPAGGQEEEDGQEQQAQQPATTTEEAPAPGEGHPVAEQPATVEEAAPPADAPAPDPAVAVPVQPIPVNAPPAPAPPMFQRGPTLRDMLEFAHFRVAKVRGYAAEAEDMPEATSREYDTEWARMVLCWRIAEDGGAGGTGTMGTGMEYSSAREREKMLSFVRKREKERGCPSPLDRNHRLSMMLTWRNGRVYERGMLTGLWQGKIYFPADSSIEFIANTRTYPRNLTEVNLGLNMRPIFVRFAEHGKVRVPGPHDEEHASAEESPLAGVETGHGSTDLVVHNKPVPAPRLVTTFDPRYYPHPQFANENMNNAWIEGKTGSLLWEHGGSGGGNRESEASTLLVGGVWGDGSTRDAIVERHRESEVGVEGGAGPGMRMKSLAFCVPNTSRATSEDTSRQEVKQYVYETYEKGGECAHHRLEEAKDVRSVRGLQVDTGSGEATTPYFYIHPGCLKCREKERVVQLIQQAEEKEKSEWRRQAKLKAERKEHERLMAELAAEAEKMFASHGLGMDEGSVGGDVEMGDDEESGRKEVVNVEFGTRPFTRGGWSPIASHSRSSQHSRHTSSVGDGMTMDEDGSGESDPLAAYAFNPSHLPPCEDGVEDTIITGDVDERRANAWGRFMYYGRVRPWDGLIGFIRLQILHPDLVPGQEHIPLSRSGGEGSGGLGIRHGPTTEGMLGTKLFFYGYIHAGKTIVGNWRYTGIEATSATVESAFMLSRKDD